MAISTLTAVALVFLLALTAVDAGDHNGVFQPCADTKVQRFDGFTFGIAFASKEAFFYNQTQLSPCDNRLNLGSKSAQIAVFRPKVDEISLLTINDTTPSSCLLPCLQDLTLGIRARLKAMATTSNVNQYHEGQSTQRPPLFDGTNYNYWKCRMRIYLQSINYEIWHMTETEYTAPTIPYAQWNDDQKNQTMNNAKAMNALFCALTKEEFNRVSNATTAHQIWHILEVTHEGTNKVKESKISVLAHRFEMFRMKDNETVSEMITRFTDIANSLVALGKTYTQAEMVRKVLRALTPEWEKKTTSIEEANDLSQLSLENLVGNLMAYEVQLEDRKKDAESQQAKKKLLAFKAMTDSEDEEEDEEEIAMFTRRFKKFLKKGKFNSKIRDSNDPPTCFRCNKTGHMKKDCSLENTKNKEKISNFKKDKYSKNKFAKNKKAYQATWDDSDSSSEEETDENNEVANMCFMASQEHVTSGGFMVAFAGKKYAARSFPIFVGNSSYSVTSFTLVLEFHKGTLQNLYWKRDGCASCSGKTNFVCLSQLDCAIRTSSCKSQGGQVDCNIGIQTAFSGTDKHDSVLNSWYEVSNLKQYSLFGLYSNLRNSLTSQFNSFF